MTQSFLFGEPEADLGQRVFSGPSLMPPWKQSTTSYDPLAQSDYSAMVNPGSSSDKGPRIRRWSDDAMQGMYVDQLQPHGRSVRLSTDPLQSSSMLEQCNPPSGNVNSFGVHLAGADQSFQIDRRGGNYMRMVEHGSYGVPDTTNFMGSNSASTPFAFGAHANAYAFANHDHVSSDGGRSVGVPGQAFANLQALFAQGRGGLCGVNASTFVAPDVSSQYNHGASVQAPAPYAPRAQLNSSASIITTAGDRGFSSVWNQNGFENNAESVTLACGDGRGGSGSWPDLLSCHSGTLENNASQCNMFDSSVGMAEDGFVRPQSPCTPRGHHQRINTVLSDAQQDYLQEIERLNSMAGEIRDSPHRNSRGRRLGYTAPAQPSPSDIFDYPVNPQGEAANVYGLGFDSDIAQHVGSSTQGTTVESAVSESTGISNAEQPQQDGLYSQTYEPQAPAMAAAGGVEIGDKGDLSGHKFDLNEVPGYAEATPKRRKKYHPIVAKDKRTYKKRRVDGNYQNSPSKKPGVNVEHDTAMCDCEACVKVRLERRLHAGQKFRHGEQTRSSMDGDSRQEVRWSTVADSMALSSEARETIFNQSPDARNSGGADDVFSNVQSPVSPPERGSRSLGSPDSSSKSPSVRRNLFAALSSLDVAAAGSEQGDGSSGGAWSAHHNVGANLATLQEMVAQHRDITMAMSRRNLLYQELHSGSALSGSYGGVHPGAIVPARVNNPGLQQLEWNPGAYTNSFDHIRSVCNTNNSFMSRLCPRGILSPQEVPFRNMNKIQRVVYLKSILMSKRLDMTPESLLQHVHGHLPESEKEDFTRLWDFILTPVTNDQMQQLAQHAQMELPAGALTPQLQSEDHIPLEKLKPKAAKKPSRRELELNPTAMTLWPDLMQEQSNSKQAKEKRRKASNVEHGQERQNSNGNIDTQGLEMVPFENKSMVPYDGPFNPLRKRKPRAKVVLDNETVRVWKLLMGKNGSQENETDADKELKWEEERRKMKAQALLFIDRMHIVQGDRSFSCWKGSVVDSVVGAFLTQNVNDVLSSSAFMSMRSRFPGRGFRKQTEAPPEVTDVAESSESELVHPPPPATKTEESDQEPKISQEASSTYKPSVQRDIAVHSIEPPPNIVLESPESHNEESYEHLHLEEYQESTQETTPKEDQLPHEITLPAATASELSDSEQSQTAAKTSNSASDNTDSGLEFQGVAATENAATTEESSGANNGNPLEVGSELVEGNQPSHGKYNPKTGLTGLERAKIEEKQVTARKSFDFSGLQDEFKPRTAGQERPAAPPRTDATEDGVDWEAVRRAKVEEVADVIKERGLNWILAGRIKAFLERLHRDYGALDLEWLRSMSTDQTKEFLLSIRGLGLKSVECIRLLTLHHLAFPVDTNVGRICVRLGWVPLEPLPEELQLHLLELYPVQATIQKYLWPRLCKLDQATLYELHYQMITFGKVFCTKSKPNCNACPMRPECKHFASALSSAKLALPASERPNNGPTLALPPGTSTAVEESISEASHPQVARPVSQYCLQPIVEEPMTPESEADAEDFDIEDYPFSVEEVDQEEAELMNMCIQKSNVTEPETIVASHTSHSEPIQEIVVEELGIHSDSCGNNVIKIVDSNEDEGVGGALVGDIAPSQEMVLVPPGAASLPVPKLKNVGRLRTVHYVYELPDKHALLDGLDPREADDPCTYLLAIWSPGEVPESIPNINDSVNEDNTFASSSSEGEESIKATLLVPCRTAMKGSFPLNGTYFQVNEVFADHESSLQPILVPRKLLWNLRRRFVFFGTTVTSIFRGMTVEEIQACFWRGYVCVRGFDRETRAPKPLVGRLHLQAGKSSGKGANMDA